MTGSLFGAVARTSVAEVNGRWTELLASLFCRLQDRYGSNVQHMHVLRMLYRHSNPLPARERARPACVVVVQGQGPAAPSNDFRRTAANRRAKRVGINANRCSNLQCSLSKPAGPLAVQHSERTRNFVQQTGVFPPQMYMPH